MSRRTPFPSSADPEPTHSVRRLSINTIQDLVPGGVLRAGKRAYGDSYTGWWLGIDDDGAPKLDITFDNDTYIRFDDTGITIGGDGSALTNIDGASIQTGTITAAKLSVTNLAAVSAQTGALTVDNSLTIGAAGQITWASGDCRITDDYFEVDIGDSDIYAIRFVASGSTYGYLSAVQTANQTQISIRATGPAETKAGRIAFSAVEWLAGPEDDDPATVSVLIDSGTGVSIYPLAYSAGCTFAVSDMDATFSKDLVVTGELTAGTAVINNAGTGCGIDMGYAYVKTVQEGITEVRIDRYGVLLKNIYTTAAGWARTFLRYTDDDDVQYFGIGGRGSGQTFTRAWWGPSWDDTWITIWDSPCSFVWNEEGSDYDFRIESDTRTHAFFVQGSDGYVGINTSAPAVDLDVNADSIRIRTAKTPASAGAAGTQGQICWSSSYIYVCTATNTWKRAALSSW